MTAPVAQITAPQCAAPIGGTPGDMVRCPLPGRGSYVCPVAGCGLHAYYCSGRHKALARRTLGGHRLRQHPETLPQVLDDIRRSPSRIAEVQAAAALMPDQFVLLLAALGLGPS